MHELHIKFVFRYDHERGRFTDPPSEYLDTMDKTGNFKYCESCVRKAAQEQVETNNSSIDNVHDGTLTIIFKI